MKKYNTSIFIFRRDLRLEDNTGLIAACKNSLKVIPCFILDERLLNKSSKKYSNFRLQFLYDCLIDLDEGLKEKKSHLYFFHDDPINIIKKITKQVKIDAVFFNTDYTPFSRKRDSKIKEICEKLSIQLEPIEDILLHQIETVKKKNGEPYKVFTAFKNKSMEFQVRKPQSYKFLNLENKNLKFETSKNEIQKILSINNNNNKIKGGRKEVLRLLENISKLKNYETERNYPFSDATSKLSPHNRFGTCSIREVYNKIEKEHGRNHQLITEIYWRDFFTYIMYHFPESFSLEFNKKFRRIDWNQNKSDFSKWCNGETGFPIVDAGMRELNKTGFMHNRVRMIVASFLTKDLHIDWRLGEKYFASKLIDYDPSVNIGNWQWAASTGCDAQPWFRIFNPRLQQEKYDPKCKYIKKWVEELRNADPGKIHLKNESTHKELSYPEPIIDHKKESEIAKNIFQIIANNG